MNGGQSNGIKVVGYFDCFGGGQVVVRDGALKAAKGTGAFLKRGKSAFVPD